MEGAEYEKLFRAHLDDVKATILLTKSRENGTLNASEYAQLRCKRLGHSDLFQSFLVPIFEDLRYTLSGWFNGRRGFHSADQRDCENG